MAAIEISGLSKDYLVGFWRKRRFRALDRLSLQVEQGEVFGFLGPNGAGKTTTLKILTGLIFPTEGTATILGTPAGQPEAFLHAGFLPENPYFYDYLTPRELLDYFARFFPLAPDARKRRCDAVLGQVGLSEVRDRPLRKFSKGMLQRVGIAQALLNEPDLVIFDEPMSGLDPLGRRDVRALILSLRDRGCTVFFSSHVLSDAEALCSRVAILARGRLVASGGLSQMLAFEASGWELVVAGISDRGAPTVGADIRRVVPIGEGRYALDLPLDPPPERVMVELAASGAKLISLNPIRPTLEDLFVEQVTSEAAMAPRQGGS